MADERYSGRHGQGSFAIRRPAGMEDGTRHGTLGRLPILDVPRQDRFGHPAPPFLIPLKTGEPIENHRLAVPGCGATGVDNHVHPRRAAAARQFFMGLS
jgi:hypothetical protein